MAQTKYKEYVEKMLRENKDLFDKFQPIHDKYALDPDSHQEEFNQVGEKVMNIVNEYDNKLCASSERGGYGKFTSNLSEKFRAEIKNHYSMLDHIGIIPTKREEFLSPKGKDFVLKKISLPR